MKKTDTVHFIKCWSDRGIECICWGLFLVADESVFHALVIIWGSRTMLVKINYSCVVMVMEKHVTQHCGSLMCFIVCWRNNISGTPIKKPQISRSLLDKAELTRFRKRHISTQNWLPRLILRIRYPSDGLLFDTHYVQYV